MRSWYFYESKNEKPHQVESAGQTGSGDPASIVLLSEVPSVGWCGAQVQAPAREEASPTITTPPPPPLRLPDEYRAFMSVRSSRCRAKERVEHIRRATEDANSAFHGATTSFGSAGVDGNDPIRVLESADELNRIHADEQGAFKGAGRGGAAGQDCDGGFQGLAAAEEVPADRVNRSSPLLASYYVASWSLGHPYCRYYGRILVNARLVHSRSTLVQSGEATGLGRVYFGYVEQDMGRPWNRVDGASVWNQSAYLAWLHCNPWG
ncbi:hypothetical protein LY76DRAFT_610641 [Colletotrichum caudatum]|nr:hypothetical protein LY76DRAFT_610641 [Colletotrichum caudatum]